MLSFLLLPNNIMLFCSFSNARNALLRAGTIAQPCKNLDDYVFAYDKDFVYDQVMCSYMSPKELVRKSLQRNL